MQKTQSTTKNKTAITNPKTKSQNTTANTRSKTSATKNTGKSNAVEFAQDQNGLDDKEIISDILGSHKNLIKLYGTALCETSCKKLRTLINSQLSECATDQFDAFLYMSERGLYPTDTATAPKINQVKKKFSQAEQKMKK